MSSKNKFWCEVFRKTHADWVKSCERQDSFSTRLVHLKRLDAVIQNMISNQMDEIERNKMGDF